MTDTPSTPQQTELLVCVKCRAQQAPDDDARRPGQRLFDALNAQDLPQGVTLHPVECLQNCEAGCTIALRGGARWTYVYGGLNDAQDVDTLLEGASRYHATSDGLIPWRERPDHFKRNCIARIPPADFADQSDKVTT